MFFFFLDVLFGCCVFFLCFVRLCLFFFPCIYMYIVKDIHLEHHLENAWRKFLQGNVF